MIYQRYRTKSRFCVNPVDDGIEFVSQLSTWFTALAALCVRGQYPSFAVQWIMGFLLIIVNTFTALIQVFGLCIGMPYLLMWLKNYFRVFTFSNTDRDIEDGLLTNIVPRWNLEKECLYRVWQPFWRSLLLQCGMDTVHRLTELEVVAMECGREQIEKHWEAENNSSSLTCRAVQALLEGVDVFVDENALGFKPRGRGINGPKAGFGKLVIQPYPFECKFSWDFSKNAGLTISDPTVVETLLSINLSPAICQRRTLRQQLRGLSASQTFIELPFSRIETETVDDGTITTFDKDGSEHTKLRQSTVEFECYYFMAVVVVQGETDKPMAPGLSVHVCYSDGRGEVVAPTTGEVFKVTNRKVIMGIDHLGLTENMDVIGPQWENNVRVRYATLLREQGCRVRDSHQAYREGMAKGRHSANLTLGDAFWYMVYTNPSITRSELETYVTEHEANKMLRDLPALHRQELDLLYWRMEFVRSHPGRQAWYIFWDDFYARNGNMTVVTEHAVDFDPINLGSICYRVMPRNALRAWLSDKQLMGLPFLWKMPFRGRLLFNEESLDCLYATLSEASK